MSGTRPEQSSNVITGSTLNQVSVAAGSGARAQVSVTGSGEASGAASAEQQVLELIQQLKAELGRLADSDDAETAAQAAQATGPLEKLEGEVQREQSRGEHLKAMLTTVVGTVAGLASVAELVRSLQGAVERILA